MIWQLLVCLCSIATNTKIYAPKNKSMKATSLGIWYVQIPSGIVVNPIGVIVEPKTHKGSRYVVVNRKIKAVSKLPHLNYSDAMRFKEIFWY